MKIIHDKNIAHFGESRKSLPNRTVQLLEPGAVPLGVSDGAGEAERELKERAWIESN